MSNLKQIECFTLAEWLKNDKLVLLTGAGISVSAGLQPFRVNNRSLNKGNLSALEFYSNGDPMRVFNHVAKMVEDARDAKPSKFHLFLKTFIKVSLKNYSMNIDCLENEVRTRSLDGFYTDLSSLTIRLHGEVLKAICFRCSKVYELTDTILKSWKSSDSSGLINCEDSQCLCRPRDSKLRQLKVNPAKLRPHIVLYDEELPINAQERIQECLLKDSLLKPDILLIVGTSLSTDVNGQQMIISHFKKNNSSIKVVHININKPNSCQQGYYCLGEADQIATTITKIYNPNLRLTPPYIRKTKVITRRTSKSLINADNHYTFFVFMEIGFVEIDFTK